MELGLALPQFDISLPGGDALGWEVLAGWAATAEGLGFASVWLADHLDFSYEKYGAAPATSFAYDPLVALAGLARTTSSVRLGTLVLCGPLRPAGVLAQSLATLDQLSNGRLIVGLGAGWYERDFRLAGLTMPAPRARLRALATLVDDVSASLEGRPGAIPCRPGPVQAPRPPLWVGGRGDRLLDLVAAHADGWNVVWTMTVAEWAARAAVLDAACERHGRAPSSVHRSVGLYALVGEDEADLRARFARLQAGTPDGVLDGVDLATWRTGHLVGTVEQVADQLRAWEAAGVGSVVAGVGAVPFAAGALDDLAPLAAAAALARS